MSTAPSKLRALLIQALRFVGLSGIGWLLDFTVYTLLSTRVSNLAAVNMISSLVGASFVFAFSTRFVFRDNHRIPLFWKYCVYIAYHFAAARKDKYTDNHVYLCRAHRQILRHSVQDHRDSDHHDAQLLRHALCDRKAVKTALTQAFRSESELF